MKKKFVLVGIGILLLGCIFFQSYAGAYDKCLHNINYKAITLLKINPQEIIIHNPYEDVDFSKTKHYKANLHTHTTKSDGASLPSEVIYHYQAIGNYAILALTDHNKNSWPWSKYIVEEPLDHSASSSYYPDLDMLAISGNEMSIGHHRGSLLNSYPGGGMFKKFTFWLIEKQHGMSLFYHPGRYDYDVEWYQQYFDNYRDCLIGIEVYNQGDRYEDDRLLWDKINKERAPDDLIWGFSNDDMHNITDHAFRNYQHFLMENLSEYSFRVALNEGAFYFSYEPNGSDSNNLNYGEAMTPRLIDVDIQNNKIYLTADDVFIFIWYDDNSQVISINNFYDVSQTDSNFVRAILINEYGKSYTQPFGITRMY